jgi:hypothetical protein
MSRGDDVTRTFDLRATDKQISQYRALVDSDWNRGTLERALGLLWATIDPSSLRSDDSWLPILEYPAGRRPSDESCEQVNTAIKSLARVFTEPAIPKLPAALSTTRTKAAVQAQKVWTYLTLQAMARLRGETGFFLDLQSLLFLCSVHYLLPQLARERLKSEHDFLVNAMYVHTILCWRTQPEHLYYLQAAMFGYLENHSARLEKLRLSLELTPVLDHSFLTKANAYWAELMEMGRRKAAMTFLLSLSRTVPQSYVEEIGEMVQETADTCASK